MEQKIDGVNKKYQLFSFEVQQHITLDRQGSKF